jgi:hypothetical protein
MKVRITHYKSWRGRPNGIESSIVDADFIQIQSDDTVIVQLHKSIYGYPAGHKIAVRQNNIIKS